MHLSSAQNRLTATLFPLLLFIFLLAIFYPGGMTSDSFGWLIRARTGEWGDSKSLGPTLFWQLFDPLYPGPMPFIALNLALVVFSASAIVSRLTKSRWLSWAMMVAFISFPPVLSIMGIAWRDVTGLGITLATFAMVLAYRERPASRPHIWPLTLIILLTFAGALFRDNHAAGVLPFLLWAAWHYFGFIANRKVRFTASLTAAFLAGTIATLAAMGILKATATHKSWIAQAPQNYLLARLSSETHENLFPPDLYPGLTLPEIRTRVQERYPLFWRAYQKGKDPLLPRLQDQASNDRLAQALNNAIMEHPALYLKIRLDEMSRWLEPSRNHKSSLKTQGFTNLDIFGKHVNFDTEKPAWSGELLSQVRQYSKPVYMNNPLYGLSAAMLLLALAWRFLSQRIRLAAGLALASAALHYLGVIGYVFHYEFRYGHQAIAMSWFAILLILNGLWLKYREKTLKPSLLHASLSV
jgi:hypothetical protein